MEKLRGNTVSAYFWSECQRLCPKEVGELQAQSKQHRSASLKAIIGKVVLIHKVHGTLGKLLLGCFIDGHPIDSTKDTHLISENSGFQFALNFILIRTVEHVKEKGLGEALWNADSPPRSHLQCLVVFSILVGMVPGTLYHPILYDATRQVAYYSGKIPTKSQKGLFKFFLGRNHSDKEEGQWKQLDALFMHDSKHEYWKFRGKLVSPIGLENILGLPRAN